MNRNLQVCKRWRVVLQYAMRTIVKRLRLRTYCVANSVKTSEPSMQLTPMSICPAISARSTRYPFGDRIPMRLEMRRTVSADPKPLMGFQRKGRLGVTPIAVIAQRFDCWTSSDGDVSAILADGGLLPLQPHQFTVLTWRELAPN